MAFVFRNQRKSQLNKKLNPGPGSYEIKQIKQPKLSKAFVPFGSMQPKLRSVTQHKNETPGVGSYNIDLKANGQKIIVSSQTQDIKILQISRPNPVFKSGTVRFKNQIQNQQDLPGPGDYQINRDIGRNKIYSVGGASNKSKVIQHLINLNKYQSIPSIPSNIHAFGYNDALQLNQPPIEIHKGQKQDVIGPGHYDSKIQTIKPKGIAWSQPKTKRMEPIKSDNQNLGPGSYQVRTMQPLYSFKPSPQFASSTLRSMDQRKGYIPNATVKPNNIIKQSRITQQPGQSRVLSQKAPPSTHYGGQSSDQDSIQYIDETTPGPGAYQVTMNSTNKKFNNIRQQKSSFGVSSKRFTKRPQQTANIGPGQYYRQIQARTFKCKTMKKDKNTDDRFPALVQPQNALVPGPGSYQPRNTMQDKLIYKIQRGYRGQFGSTQARGKQTEDNQQPGPASYDPKQIIDEKSSHSVFKSVSKRKGLVQNTQNPAPGTYNINSGDIITKFIRQKQQDPDLIIKKPGFGVAEQRFKSQKIIEQQDYQDDDIIKQIQQKYRQEQKRKNLKPSFNFKSKQPRFNTKQMAIKKQIPGPGSYYDGQQDYWNKRTYNILFADI